MPNSTARRAARANDHRARKKTVAKPHRGKGAAPRAHDARRARTTEPNHRRTSSQEWPTAQTRRPDHQARATTRGRGHDTERQSGNTNQYRPATRTNGAEPYGRPTRYATKQDRTAARHRHHDTERPDRAPGNTKQYRPQSRHTNGTEQYGQPNRYAGGTKQDRTAGRHHDDATHVERYRRERPYKANGAKQDRAADRRTGNAAQYRPTTRAPQAHRTNGTEQYERPNRYATKQDRHNKSIERPTRYGSSAKENRAAGYRDAYIERPHKTNGTKQDRPTMRNRHNGTEQLDRADRRSRYAKQDRPATHAQRHGRDDAQLGRPDHQPRSAKQDRPATRQQQYGRDGEQFERADRQFRNTKRGRPATRPQRDGEYLERTDHQSPGTKGNQPATHVQRHGRDGEQFERADRQFRNTKGNRPATGRDGEQFGRADHRSRYAKQDRQQRRDDADHGERLSSRHGQSATHLDHRGDTERGEQTRHVGHGQASTHFDRAEHRAGTEQAEHGEVHDGASFAELGLPNALVRALRAAGVTAPFPIQSATLPDALAGRDVLGRAQTGSGKTLAFGLAQLARLHHDGGSARPGRPRALVLVPTRELAMQVTDALLPLAKALGMWCRTVVGGMSFTKQVDQLNHGIDLLIATPGRLSDHIRQGTATLDDVRITAIDEADQMADMGFLPQVRAILDLVPAGQRMLFSATLDNDVATLIDRYLTDPATHSTDPATAAVSTMEHHLLLVSNVDKAAVVAEMAAREGRTILFLRTKHHVDRLTRQLRAAGVRAGALHGGKPQGARNRVLGDFRDGRLSALVATDVAARGIHVDGVSLVVHVDPPADAKGYLHRAGRTARAGETGTVVTLVTHDQRRTVFRMTEQAGVRPERTKVHPGNADLVRITGARTPSGEPVTDDPTRRPGGRFSRPGRAPGRPRQRR